MQLLIWFDYQLIIEELPRRKQRRKLLKQPIYNLDFKVCRPAGLLYMVDPLQILPWYFESFNYLDTQADHLYERTSLPFIDRYPLDWIRSVWRKKKTNECYNESMTIHFPQIKMRYWCSINLLFVMNKLWELRFKKYIVLAQGWLYYNTIQQVILITSIYTLCKCVEREREREIHG